MAFNSSRSEGVRGFLSFVGAGAGLREDAGTVDVSKVDLLFVEMEEMVSLSVEEVGKEGRRGEGEILDGKKEVGFKTLVLTVSCCEKIGLIGEMGAN